MLYVRGNKWDYDHWASLGNLGWSYSDVLPLFKRSENNEQFKDNFHGQGGPSSVTYQNYESAITRLFLDAAATQAIPLNPDYIKGDSRRWPCLWRVVLSREPIEGSARPPGGHLGGRRFWFTATATAFGHRRRGRFEKGWDCCC